MKKWSWLIAIAVFIVYLIVKPSEADLITNIPDFSKSQDQNKSSAPSISEVLKDTYTDTNGKWHKAQTTQEAQKLYQHVEPDWDIGAFPEVSAEEGGKGFQGEGGWKTNSQYNYVGDPRAIKGGKLRLPWTEYPKCFRLYGRSSTTTQIQMFVELMYEPLLSLDPLTLKAIPRLATHWKISDDQKTFWFRLNPSARWSDGRSVKASDVVETYKLLLDSGIESPTTNTYYKEKIESVESVSRYIVKFKMKTSSWRNFMTAFAIRVLPGHVIKKMNGAQYLKKFQYSFPPCSGPFQFKSKTDGESFTIKRRADYWGKNLRSSIGMYNFDEVTFIVMADPSKQFEAVKIGELDTFVVGRAQRWVQETNSEKFQKGYLKKRKIFTCEPVGISGLWFNMRQSPLNEINVRKAINHSIDFKTMNEKFFYKQYLQMNSYFQNSRNASPNTTPYEFDLNRATELLKQSGWSERNSEGYLVKDGKELKIRMILFHPSFTRIEQFIGECLKKVGIRMVIDKMTWSEMIEAAGKREFQMARFGLTGSLYPYPTSLYHSKFAHVNQSSNRWGVDNKRIDELCDLIEKESDSEKRILYYQEMDKILYEEIVPMALAWFGPYVRVIFPASLGHPTHYTAPYADGDTSVPIYYWWFDPEKKRALDQAVKSETPLTQGEVNNTYWRDWLEKQQKEKR